MNWFDGPSDDGSLDSRTYERMYNDMEDRQKQIEKSFCELFDTIWGRHMAIIMAGAYLRNKNDHKSLAKEAWECLGYEEKCAYALLNMADEYEVFWKEEHFSEEKPDDDREPIESEYCYY
jgi:hypothetical protein